MNNSQPQFKLQELHTPSSFEGVVWALMGIEDARTIIHSAPGYYFNMHNNTLLDEWPMELYTSHLKFSSVMKGGEDQLADVIDAIAEKRPAALFVVTAPVTETSQDDAEGVCERIGYPHTRVVRPAIGQSCNQGKEAAFQALIDMMDGDAEKRPRSVNLIGPATCDKSPGLRDEHVHRLEEMWSVAEPLPRRSVRRCGVAGGGLSH